MKLAALAVVAAACGGGSSAELDRREDIARCRRANTQISANPAEAKKLYVRGCKDLYREPACRDAFVHQLDDEDRWPASVAEACARAYCDKLDDPKPKLCTTHEADGRAALVGAWNQLDRRILALEVGPSFEAMLGPDPGAPVTSIPVAPPDAPRRKVRLALEAAGDRLVVHVGSLAWQLSEVPSATELQPILATLGDAAGTEVVIEAPGSTSYKSVDGVLRALESAGYSQITFTVPPP